MTTTTLSLPEAFAARLAQIVPAAQLPAVMDSFACEKPVAFRVNTLKAEPAAVLERLRAAGFTLTPLDYYPAAAIVPAAQKRALTETPEFYAGEIYLQNLSSQLAALLVAPQAGEAVLDLAAAPGGKTTLLAALMQNDGRLSAVEPVKDRFFRLKRNLDEQGVTMARCYMHDGRAVGSKTPDTFDRVLLDAPCSSEARFDLNDPETLTHWTPAKVKECSKKQQRLLLSALQAVKPGGLVLYSTCSFAPEENEGVLAYVLDRLGDAVTLEAIELPIANTQPGITHWQGKDWPAAVALARRILPNEVYDGFFIAKLRRLK
ncbi:RsmB/NOP family class I SAM-dependent RNA methyltransferase [Chitinibacter tainanensis]|uniref:RsmB/NOP family class I SAM-dependent RNA methyltransferase n=1 Tax=Chitinibacter tainanensis TaxID=230667 RepID=UPI002355C83D|nr:RsmB/NOP family class I SAM-dependent RNA methyltransferase [Chitinibacter tainanensis]